MGGGRTALNAPCSKDQGHPVPQVHPVPEDPKKRCETRRRTEGRPHPGRVGRFMDGCSFVRCSSSASGRMLLFFKTSLSLSLCFFSLENTPPAPGGPNRAPWILLRVLRLLRRNRDRSSTPRTVCLRVRLQHVVLELLPLDLRAVRGGAHREYPLSRLRLGPEPRVGPSGPGKRPGRDTDRVGYSPPGGRARKTEEEKWGLRTAGVFCGEGRGVHDPCAFQPKVI